MSYYILNKNQQSTGEHEVHNRDVANGCLPYPSNQILLGNFSNCHDAVQYARRQYPGNTIDGCYYCANACHTR
jgi:hypothetical protein